MGLKPSMPSTAWSDRFKELALLPVLLTSVPESEAWHGWAEMGFRERLFALWLGVEMGVERVDSINRARYYPGSDAMAFGPLRLDNVPPIAAARVQAISFQFMCLKFGMSEAQLAALVEDDFKPPMIVQTVITVAQSPAEALAEADEMWEKSGW